MSESESGSEEQKQKSKGGGIDYIMSLPDVPRNLPPHVELQRTRVFANIDAPTHVFPTLQNPLFLIILFTSFLNFQFSSIPIICFCLFFLFLLLGFHFLV